MTAHAPDASRLPLWRGAGIAAGIAGLLAMLGLLGTFQFLDLRIHDWRYRLRGALPASPRIALVEVDDQTLAAYRAWPLPRETYAILITALEDAGVRAVGFDLLFLGDNGEDSTGDALLASVTAGQGNLVHAMTFLPEDATLGGGASSNAPGGEALPRHGRPVALQTIAAARRVALPYHVLLESADALGHTTVSVDRDGVVRRIPQFIRYGNWAYPSLAIRLVESAARRDSTLPQFELAPDGVVLHWHGRRLHVPADAEGATSIDFAGDRASFPQTYSMLRVLQWYRDGDSTSLARAFRDKLVLVGMTAEGEVAADIGATPFSEASPLVYIHANAVNAALQGRFLASPPEWVVFLILLVVGALLGALYSGLTLGWSAGIGVAAMAAIAGLDQLLFASARVAVPPTAALLLPPVAWIAVEGVRRRSTERRVRERERELDVARTIQQRLLPSEPPQLPEFDVFGANVPAEAVGGDYYDWIPLGSDGLAVVVGDVSGHGVPAALLMSHLHASVHAQASPGRTGSAIVADVHTSLYRAVQSGRFATFFLGLLSRSEFRLHYCNAGHNPPLLVHNGKLDTLPATGLPLAMLDFGEWTDAACDFQPGDVLVLYSDGVTECPFRQDMYGDERLERLVLELAAGNRNADQIGRAILADLRAYARRETYPDDVTIVVVRRNAV